MLLGKKKETKKKKELLKLTGHLVSMNGVLLDDRLSGEHEWMSINRKDFSFFFFPSRHGWKFPQLKNHKDNYKESFQVKLY